MALALSASLAQAQKKAEEEFFNEIGCDPPSGPASNPNPVPDVLLPDAIDWPIGYDKKPLGKLSLVKTTLQVTVVFFLILGFGCFDSRPIS